MQRALDRLSHALLERTAATSRRLDELHARIDVRMVSKGLCLAGASIGALALVGWAVHAAWLTRLLEGEASIRPPAALSALLLGIAGALRADGSTLRRVTSLVAAALALVIGSVAGLEDALRLGVSPLDRLGFKVDLDPYPTRMSPSTATAVVLLSVAILLIDVRRRARFRASEWLALAAGIVALTGLLAHLFGGGPVFHVDSRVFASISVPAGVSVVVTSLGIVLGVDGSELVHVALSPGPGGVLFRRLAPATVLAPVLLGVLLSRALKMIDVSGFPMAYAVLASGAMVAGFAILTATARPLDEMHRLIRWERDFFSAVGTVLTTSLEREPTLARVADLLVEDLADTCIVDVIDERGEVRRVAVAGRDPATAWARECVRTIALDRAKPHLVFEALQKRRSVLWERVTPEMLASLTQGEEHLRTMTALEPRSVIAVPLLVRDELLGVVALISSDEMEPYGAHELAIAVEVAQRTSLWLENVRLYRAAQRAIRDRDELMGVIVHDLRNPLGTILLQAGLLGLSLEAHQLSRKPADVIDRAARRMSRLITDLLDITCVEAGRLSLQLVELVPRQLVVDAVESQRAHAEAASLELRVDVAEELPTVIGDRHRLLQAFENLIGNAAKFTPAGGSVTVGAVADDVSVRFWVADTGVGISAADLPHLFDRFWHKGEHRGAGLGLPIVRGIVEAHGGRIWVESVEGQGSTFSFTIPLAATTRALPPVCVPPDTPVSSRPREG